MCSLQAGRGPLRFKDEQTLLRASHLDRAGLGISAIAITSLRNYFSHGDHIF
jgi:hypothetical protein